MARKFIYDVSSCVCFLGLSTGEEQTAEIVEGFIRSSVCYSWSVWPLSLLTIFFIILFILKFDFILRTVQAQPLFFLIFCWE